jgi:hypothetical protein
LLQLVGAARQCWIWPLAVSFKALSMASSLLAAVVVAGFASMRPAILKMPSAVFMWMFLKRWLRPVSRTQAARHEQTATQTAAPDGGQRMD